MENTVSYLLVGLIFLVIFAIAFMAIKRRWKNKKSIIYETGFTAQNVYLQYQNREKQKSIEHVLNQKEEKKQDHSGDDGVRFYDPDEKK